ncbi:MAG: bacillithiol biosynthesis cysteine-adding enzyme BshC [Acidobacteriota bacterium]
MSSNQSSSVNGSVGEGHARQDSLSFTVIPRTTRLFNDYLYDHNRVIQFYRSSEHSQLPLNQFAHKITAQSFERGMVADALERQNRRFGSSSLTFQYIDLLRDPDTVAVVTGQQAGLFAGPLFTIYKALTAIKLAENLRQQGSKAVPIFWIASEDHDYQEVNHCQVVNNEGQLIKIQYESCLPAGERSVGDIKLQAEIAERITELFAILPKSEFVEQLEKDLRDAYQVGIGFAEAFARLLARLFANYGVILLDPQEPELKQLAARVYEPVLRNCEQVAEQLVKQSHTLEEAGYHAQIHTSLDMVPLFVCENNQRSAMTREGNCFILKTTSQCRSLSDLLQLMEKDPAAFSPSVAIRPAVQDWLLPTLIYVAGPAETAYFAQLRPVYQFLDRIPPSIVPRASLTVIPERFATLLEKYELKFEDLFAGSESVMRKVVEKSLDANTAAVFEETEQIFNTQLDKLRNALSGVDATLADALEGGRDKILYQVQNLRNRFVNNRTKREDTVARQIERMFNLLYPTKNLQERELNVYYFLARYGYGFIDTLYQAIEPHTTTHKLLFV